MPADDAEPAHAELMTRRAALARAAAALGGALSAPAIAGVLAGCGGEAPPPATARAAPAAAYRFRALTAEQGELVAAVAEQVLPETATPGARSARVHEFVDRMLADYYAAPDRARFVAGLGRLDARAGRRHGRPFVRCTAAQQFALVDALDAQAFPDAPNADAGAAARRDPVTQNRSDAAGQSYTSAAGAASGAAAADGTPDPEDVGRGAFFRTLKELTLVGYYTSQAGATRELRVNPMGRYRGDVPYRAVGSSWA